MTVRGRPRLTDEERERRRIVCRAWAAEIKRNSGLSAKNLARKLGYGSGDDHADGRAWRALASGSRAPSLDNFRRMTAQAAKNRWLDSFGWLRYSTYWNPNGLADDETLHSDTEQIWRNSTLGRVLLVLLAHARKCGIDQDRFFSEARVEMESMALLLPSLGDDEIERRARRVASTTAQELLDGPEYPTTRLVLDDLEDTPDLIRRSNKNK